jgi:D-3-phosphoglycerate dehydrogenase
MSSKTRFLLLESIHDVARQQLEQAGFEVRTHAASLKEDELIEALRDVDILGIRSKTQVTPRVLEAASHLKAIGAFCIGTNQISLNEAMKRGIVVFNAPFSNTRSVAELVMAEVVMLSRQLGDRVREMHTGIWRKVASGAHEVRGKTLGVIGYGHIGRQIGVLAEAFGMRVVFYDVATVLPMGNNQPRQALEEMLGESDFVTLHVPATPQTHMMIGAKEIAAMRPGACLINASRGTVVDLAALHDALVSGHVAGAAVDVFPEEPEANVSEGFRTELQGLGNVILTPHIGGSTLEAQESIGREVATSLSKFAHFGSTIAAVNFPNVEMPTTAGTHRVMNVHRNVPGVLRDINRIVSDHNANVHGQVLSTNPDIGYLLMDFDQPVALDVCSAMNALSTTIRASAL